MVDHNQYLPNAHSVELVIFDCDGVLVDSELLCAQVLEHELQGMGLPIDCDYVLTHFLGRHYRSMVQNIQQNFHYTLPGSFKAYYRDKLLEAFEDRLQPTPGVERLLSSLSVACCVATSSSPERTRRALELAGLSGYFGAHVYTASEVENGKPAPDLFLHAANRMNVAPESCLVIEDSLAGLTAAVSAGMNVWRYTGASHLTPKHQGLPSSLQHIPVIDGWQMFYSVAPGLTDSRVNGS